jgi:hypothetical protein
MLNFFTDGPFHLEPWRFDALYVAAFALGWPKGRQPTAERNKMGR